MNIVDVRGLSEKEVMLIQALVEALKKKVVSAETFLDKPLEAIQSSKWQDWAEEEKKVTPLTGFGEKVLSDTAEFRKNFAFKHDIKPT